MRRPVSIACLGAGLALCAAAGAWGGGCSARTRPIMIGEAGDPAVFERPPLRADWDDVPSAALVAISRAGVQLVSREEPSAGSVVYRVEDWRGEPGELRFERAADAGADTAAAGGRGIGSDETRIRVSAWFGRFNDTRKARELVGAAIDRLRRLRGDRARPVR